MYQVTLEVRVYALIFRNVRVSRQNGGYRRLGIILSLDFGSLALLEPRNNPIIFWVMPMFEPKRPWGESYKILKHMI